MVFFAAGSTATAIFMSNAQGCIGQNAKKTMLNNANGSAHMPTSPAQAATHPVAHSAAHEFLDDWFSDPIFAHTLRRDLRVWFANSVDGWENRFGSQLPVQVSGYEVLDELLSKCIANFPPHKPL